jgi:hypothetical protein
MSLTTPGVNLVQLQTTRVIIFVANLNQPCFAACRKRDEKFPAAGLSTWQLAFHQLRNRFRQRVKHQCKESGTRDATVSSL